MAQTNESQEQVTINVETLQPVTRTLMTIGALPTSYLISMTYEEQLLWLQNYLTKTVIPAINNNAEATQEVQNIVMALQDYINDYFNNLDVQEEINNKLEQMAQDGSLTTLIEDYVNPYIEAQNQEISAFKTSVNNQIAQQNAQIQAVESGSPLVASSVSEMTDTTRVYVNTTDGNWYYYNGTQWVSGGTYQSTGIGDKSINGNEKIINKTIGSELLELTYPYDINYNFYQERNAEHKGATSYDPSTRLPNWTNWANFKTVTIPILNFGKIKASKMVNKTYQLFLLNSIDGTVITNIKNNNIVDVTSFPTTLTVFGGSITVYEDYFIIDIGKLAESFSFENANITITYTDSDENISITFEDFLKPEWLHFETSDEEEIKEIVLPQKFKVLQNKNLVLYTQNFLNHGNIKNVSLIEMSNSNTYIDNSILLYKNNTIGNHNTKISIYEKNNVNAILEKDINVEVVSSNAGNGLNKKVLFIGDSLTDADIYPAKVKELFTDDLMNITLLGTLGTSEAPNEGRAGWYAYAYTHFADGSQGSSGMYQGSNAFWNPSTNAFDFSYYMTQQNYNSVDYVFINLGTNDIARGYTEAQIISYYNTMINSIHSYNPNIKIGLWLPPSTAIGGNSNYLKYRDRNLKVCKYLMNAYENRENENIYIIPILVANDTTEDFNTQNLTLFTATELDGTPLQIKNIHDYIHLKDTGYDKIGLVFYYWIKYFGSLDE